MCHVASQQPMQGQYLTAMLGLDNPRLLSLANYGKVEVVANYGKVEVVASSQS